MGNVIAYVSHAWCGIKNHAGDLLGITVRSGNVHQCGQFCYIKTSVNGKQRFAGGAEDRIWPFHSVTLEEGEKVPPLMATWLGWATDRNTPTFLVKNNGWNHVVTLSERYLLDNFKRAVLTNVNPKCFTDVPKQLWKPIWAIEIDERHTIKWNNLSENYRALVLLDLARKRGGWVAK